MNTVPAHVLDDPAMAWIYLRRVIEASHLIINQLLDTGLPVTDIAHSIREAHPRLPDSLRSVTDARRGWDPRRDAELADRAGWRLITSADPHWPVHFTQPFATMELNIQHLNSSIRGLRHAPFAVWAKGPGKLAELTKCAITVVGTRDISRYGQQVAGQWASDFASQGYTVVSGGADGVDAACHRAALAAGTPTIVVMAGSLDKPYPARNIRMFDQIVEAGGLVMSEYPPGTAPARHRFLTRNRLAASLGGATVVMEAALRSGALNTLNWANAMSKPTFAVPGQVTSVVAQGCLKAIQDQKAQLARVPADVTGALDAAIGMQLELNMDRDSGPSLGWEETAVFDATGLHATGSAEGTAEAIQVDTGLPMPRVIRHLRTLENAGMVKRVGSKWLKV